MTCEDAQVFFQAVPSIREKMDALCQVGLGYIKVGQQATTLSGGEAPARETVKRTVAPGDGAHALYSGRATTGLHFEDVRKLLKVLHELVEQGNTVVVIEHNLDVIKTADWIIDIGPEGGDGGGEIVATGTPEAVALVEASHTGPLSARHAQAHARGGRMSKAPPSRAALQFSSKKIANSLEGFGQDFFIGQVDSPRME